MAVTALTIGTSGIVGSAAATLLVKEGWTDFGLSRRPAVQPGVIPIAADLQDPAGLSAVLADLEPDAVFIKTWWRQGNEAENIRVNGAMVRNLFESPRNVGNERWHVALVIGLKRNLGPFEAYAEIIVALNVASGGQAASPFALP